MVIPEQFTNTNIVFSGYRVTLFTRLLLDIQYCSTVWQSYMFWMKLPNCISYFAMNLPQLKMLFRIQRKFFHSNRRFSKEIVKKIIYRICVQFFYQITEKKAKDSTSWEHEVLLMSTLLFGGKICKLVHNS